MLVHLGAACNSDELGVAYRNGDFRVVQEILSLPQGINVNRLGRYHDELVSHLATPMHLARHYPEVVMSFSNTERSVALITSSQHAKLVDFPTFAKSCCEI
jgi:hypothetical protein